MDDHQQPAGEREPELEAPSPWDWTSEPRWAATATPNGSHAAAEERFPPIDVAAYEQADTTLGYLHGTNGHAAATLWDLPVPTTTHPLAANSAPATDLLASPDETLATPAEREPLPSTDWKGLVLEIAETALLTLLIFVVMRALIQNYRIEGYSMEPNLHEQQYLFVSKVSYYVDEPKRGDIIVLVFPKGDPNGPERDYIKRIIGLPGDTVECRPGEILVNGQVIEEPYLTTPNTYTCLPTTLGPDEYYVLGDNRNASSDSHAWGALERQYIIGKAVFSYWPIQFWGRVPNYPIQAPDPQSLASPTP